MRKGESIVMSFCNWERLKGTDLQVGKDLRYLMVLVQKRTIEDTFDQGCGLVCLQIVVKHLQISWNNITTCMSNHICLSFIISAFRMTC